LVINNWVNGPKSAELYKADVEFAKVMGLNELSIQALEVVERKSDEAASVGRHTQDTHLPTKNKVAEIVAVIIKRAEKASADLRDFKYQVDDMGNQLATTHNNILLGYDQIT
jgi:hypothetical protein